MAFILFYAGMSEDRKTEQIGVATSNDGHTFTRPTDQPIIPIGEPGSWRDLRTCNPTVLVSDKQYHLFFQGIDRKNTIRIGYAKSNNLKDWDIRETPVLSPEKTFQIQDPRKLNENGLLEPCVIYDEQEKNYTMWFIHRHSCDTTNTLYRSSSKNGYNWSNPKKCFLSTGPFNTPARLHYPQVTKTKSGHFKLHITQKSESGYFRIMEFQSSDGLVSMYCR